MPNRSLVTQLARSLRPTYWATKSWRDAWTAARHGQAISRAARDICDGIDAQRMQQVRERYATETRQSLAWVRYLDYDAEIKREVFRAFKFGVNSAPHLRILDLGTGPGYWPLTCRHFGHDCVGIDIEEPIFGDLAKAVGVERHVCRVTPSLDIPMLDGRYDLITGFQIAFDNTYVRTDQPAWSVHDWREFVSTAFRRWLTPNGRIILTGVRACLKNSKWHGQDTIDFFRSTEGQVAKGQVIITNDERGRAALAAQGS